MRAAALALALVGCGPAFTLAELPADDGGAVDVDGGSAVEAAAESLTPRPDGSPTVTDARPPVDAGPVDASELESSQDALGTADARPGSDAPPDASADAGAPEAAPHEAGPSLCCVCGLLSFPCIASQCGPIGQSCSVGASCLTGGTVRGC